MQLSARQAMRTISVVLTFSAMAGIGPGHAEIYKWVDADGKVHFSDQASAEAENLERVELEPAQTISDESSQQINSKIKAASERMAQERRRTESQRQWQQRSAKSAKQRNQKTCQYYRDKLANLEYRWKLQNKKGYRQWQKDRYLVSKDRYQRDIKRHC